MKTILELITALYTLQANSIDKAAQAAVESGIAGAKDVYLAWGKEKGISAKELEAEWKLAQPEKAKGGAKGFADTYYDWLAEGARTEQEAADLIEGNESQNVRNHLTHYLNIWALCESVRQGKRVSRTIGARAKVKPECASAKAKKAEPEQPKEPAWEYNSAEPYADIKSAWETLKRNAAAKRPSKTKVHPDKVAKFNDEALTAAYTKAFQTYNTAR